MTRRKTADSLMQWLMSGWRGSDSLVRVAVTVSLALLAVLLTAMVLEWLGTRAGQQLEALTRPAGAELPVEAGLSAETGISMKVEIPRVLRQPQPLRYRVVPMPETDLRDIVIEPVPHDSVPAFFLQQNQ